jgi:hypothetical protein
MDMTPNQDLKTAANGQRIINAVKLWSGHLMDLVIIILSLYYFVEFLGDKRPIIIVFDIVLLAAIFINVFIYFKNH